MEVEVSGLVNLSGFSASCFGSLGIGRGMYSGSYSLLCSCIRFRGGLIYADLSLGSLVVGNWTGALEVDGADASGVLGWFRGLRGRSIG